MNSKRISELRNELAKSRTTIIEQTGIHFRCWRCILNFGSSEWNSTLNEDRRKIIDIIKSSANPLQYSLSTIIKMYKELNLLQERPLLNQYIFIALMETLDIQSLPTIESPHPL